MRAMVNTSVIIMSYKKDLNWRDEEIRVFLELCAEKQVLSIMDGKRLKLKI